METSNGGEWREEKCHKSRELAQVEAELRIMEMEERGWKETRAGGGVRKVEWPPPWSFGGEFDERPHVWVLKPCVAEAAEECPNNPGYRPGGVSRGVREVGRYWAFRVRLACLDDPMYLERPEGVVKATAQVKYRCQHRAEVEVVEWDEGSARATFEQLMRSRCPDCRRSSPTGL